MFHLEILEIVLQDDGGGNFIHEPLVRLTTFASDTGCDDCLVSNDGSIAFVVEHYWNFRQSLPKFSCEAAHAALVFGRLPIGLHRKSDDNGFHVFALYIIRNELQDIAGVDGSKSSGNDLQRVGHGQSCPAFAVIDGKDSHGELFFDEKMGKNPLVSYTPRTGRIKG